ncbi:family 2B encapsulin nanocompartment shell protein [Streptomyces sp. TLI_171]|uniref:family 2B encapsulin nanocompartment shell protein n=1 Tax=Streptomyces sp. TLI_171 TaxID=1938859 RepID=UPI000C19C75A|nr:family 2B encapsulin nanocompartment shell protein [Streptomyces sp. TLI_171]RKE21221.1 hypothetical protein BX266_4600 [Streptomyces sp. TLI_171]
MSVETEPVPEVQSPPQQSLSTAAARNLATTTKSKPQMQEISSRWLLRKLPWVHVSGGTYRVNRRLSHAVGRGRVAFDLAGSEVRVVAPTLRELPALRGLTDEAVLEQLAERFVPRPFAAGDLLAQEGAPLEGLLLVAHGKVERIGTGKYGDATVLAVHADGDHLGEQALASADGRWPYSVKAATAGTALALPRAAFRELLDRSPALQARLAAHLAGHAAAQNEHGEAEIGMSAGHRGEFDLPTAFVDYELTPREYELSVAQTVLRVHSRVADLYSKPMDQTQQQLGLTVEALRERQEHEIVNNPEFGLLANCAVDQRIHTHAGAPTPDDLDELLAMRRDTDYLFAHPKAIAAFGREANRRGVYFSTADFGGHRVPAWRGVPILPCGKIPVRGGSTSIIAMRTGEENQGVVGLTQVGIPDEVEPGLNVRFMGIDDKAVVNYLVSAYYSAAILVPDALGVLENVEVDHPRS